MIVLRETAGILLPGFIQKGAWFVDVGADTLVRYLPGKRSLTFFQLSLPSGAPFGLTLDPAGKLWFTADGASAN